MAGAHRGDDTIARTIRQAINGTPAVIHLNGPRGSGRTWHLDRAAAAGIEHRATVLRVSGAVTAGARPFGGIRQLFADQRVDTAETVESKAAEGSPTGDDVLDAIRRLASQRAVVILIDNVDLVDPDSVDALAYVVRHLDIDPVAVISTAVGASPWRDAGGEAIRLEPLADDDIAALLVASGVADVTAQRCAEVASGNPGLAMALADGLTADQRRGRAPIAALPRPTGQLADDLRARLADYGEQIGRALVVAASEPGGDVNAMRAAIIGLGESASSLDDAEEAGLVEIIGSRLIFIDPWTALVAPSLVAPASRRAAHRALAAAFTRPDQAASRAWQLAAAANGPSDDVANALGLVAHDAARRGALRTASTTAERAAEFDETEGLRAAHLLAALGWALDADDALGVRRIGHTLRSMTVDIDDTIAHALAEIDAFLHGDPAIDNVAPSESGQEGARSEWAQRRDRRRSIATALDCGDHTTALARINEGRTSAFGTDAPHSRDGVSTAIAHRHRGDTRQARAALLATTAGAALFDPEYVLAPGAPLGTWTALLVAADLNILAGRGDDAMRSLELNAPHVPATLADWAIVLTARAALQTEPACEPRAHPDAFNSFGSGTLLDVRLLIATGARLGDRDALDQAIALADRERLPIEGGEARLWALPLRDASDQPRERSASSGALQRCGVRGWDRRIEHLAAAAASIANGTTPGPKTVDPEVEALSAAERRVADAVASGMTNRETAALLIVSVKTVDFHLQQIYRKLGIRSRTELAIRMMQGLGND